jgi:hypothetical protein
VGALATIAACQVFLDLEQPQLLDAGLPDVGVSDAGPPDVSPAIDLCAHAKVPPMPAADDDPDTKLGPFWFAVRQTFLSTADAGGAGYDLDGVCSCFDGGPTERDAGPSCRPPSNEVVNCDQAGGIDNQLSRVRGLTGSIADDLDEASRYTEYATNGTRAVLVFLSGYNGKANDADVSLGLAPAEGIYNLPGCGAVADPNDAGLTGDIFQFRYPGGVVPDGGRVAFQFLEADGGFTRTAGGYKPLWDGCDPWVPTAGTVANVSGGGDVPTPINVQKAYVNNYEVIAAEQVGARTFFGGTIVELAQPITSIKLEPEGAFPDGKLKFRISRIVTAGRISLKSLLTLGGRTQLLGKSVCETPDLYGQLATALCQNLDVRNGRSGDFKFDAPCDALSLAAAANGVQVRLDITAPTFVPSNTDSDRCADAAVPKLGPNCELVP